MFIHIIQPARKWTGNKDYGCELHITKRDRNEFVNGLTNDSLNPIVMGQHIVLTLIPENTSFDSLNQIAKTFMQIALCWVCWCEPN